jgi:hypothetical protein
LLLAPPPPVDWVTLLRKFQISRRTIPDPSSRSLGRRDYIPGPPVGVGAVAGDNHHPCGLLSPRKDVGRSTPLAITKKCGIRHAGFRETQCPPPPVRPPIHSSPHRDLRLSLRFKSFLFIFHLWLLKPSAYASLQWFYDAFRQVDNGQK